jgi:hydroxylamine dehydrogenase
MSGLNGLKVSHDPTERLSYYLADALTQKRPNYARAQVNMKQVCSQCHTQNIIDRVYSQAEAVVSSTNAKVQHAQAIVSGLRSDGLLRGAPFSNPVDFLYFDLWHTTGELRNMGLSWAALTLSSGMATTRCYRRQSSWSI